MVVGFKKSTCTCTCTDSGINKHKPAEDLVEPIGNQTTLVKLLSPEVLWGKKDLMEFSSDTVSKTGALNQNFPHEETIGLSLDPLAKLTTQTLSPRFTSTPNISPIDRSSTSTCNVSGDFSRNSITEVTPRSDTSFEF